MSNDSSRSIHRGTDASVEAEGLRERGAAKVAFAVELAKQRLVPQGPALDDPALPRLADAA